MKVLHVETGQHLYGGAKQVSYLLAGLQQHGVESHLVCPIGSAIGRTVKESVAEVHEVPMRGDLDLGFIWRLRRIIRQVEPDLMHLHSRRGADLLGGITGRWSGIRTVLSRRVDNPESAAVVKWKYSLYDRVIAISQGIADVLLEEGVAQEKLACVRSAVDVEAYQKPCDKSWFRAEFNLPEDALVMATVAQLISRKGHRFLMQAMPRLMQRFPNLHWLIFGKGPLHEELQDEIERRGLKSHIQLAGFRQDLADIYPCLDLLVHPALMEGLGIALLQAASAGLPIVAVDAGGMPEVVEDGVNGRLVPGGSVEVLGDAVEQLLADESLRREMGESGREKMRRSFSVEQMVEGNLAVYQRLFNTDNHS
ncbi:MAG: glycosyltransferase [Candidatus Thiodiazotropha taylori]|nr:glycosyltransferase [Candidatus Thiodiazotropha taylori]MCG8080383.1 glycosyltransferase [Candidatus Thiodiazotropha taylori]